MQNPLGRFGLVLCCVLLVSCGGSSNTCVINSDVTPSTATADHSAAAPGNQVQFSVTGSVKGNCPLTTDSVGVWSTSDPTNTTISNQDPTRGLATCLNGTPAAVTITNTGTIRGQGSNPAKLTCN